MKPLFKTVFPLLFGLFALVRAGAEPAPAYLNIINSVGFSPAVDISIDGKLINKQLLFTQNTGGQGTDPGKRVLIVKSDKHDSGEANIDCKEGSSYYFMAISVKKENPKDDENPYLIKIIQLETSPVDSGYSITALWGIDNGSDEITLGNTHKLLKFPEQIKFDGVGSTFTIALGGKKGRQFKLEERGHYFVILTRKGEDEAITPILVYDAKYKVPTF